MCWAPTPASASASRHAAAASASSGVSLCRPKAVEPMPMIETERMLFTQRYFEPQRHGGTEKGILWRALWSRFPLFSVSPCLRGSSSRFLLRPFAQLGLEHLAVIILGQRLDE